MTRYAIYFSPAENEILTKAAAEWLGYNAWRNAIVEQIKIDGLSADTFWNLTESPRRYGFHATLKAPMRLVEGVSELDLHQAAQETIGRAGQAVRNVGQPCALWRRLCCSWEV